MLTRSTRRTRRASSIMLCTAIISALLATATSTAAFGVARVPSASTTQSAPASTTQSAPAASAAPAANAGGGYRMAGSDGSVYAFGASYAGQLTGTHLNRPIVAIASTPKFGYWMVASDGGIFSFGDAAFHGSTGNIHLNQPIVGMASTPTGHGYWLVASDGGIFSFGDAAFHGSTGNIHLNQPIVGMASTPTGHGYWLVASDGGIFSFGDAAFHGSTGNIHLNQPIVGMASTPTGHGYWLVASDGGIFSFGDARFYGSTGNGHLNQPIVGMASTLDGRGYWFAATDGGIFAFGNARFYGSAGAQPIPAPVIGIATQTALDPYQPGSTGYDISWPQCGHAYPAAPHAVTVVGINDGDMYTNNPCFASEAAWAGPTLTVYVNADGLPPDNASGLTGPAGTCSVADISCRSYNWGANAAAYDVQAVADAHVNPRMWWLDVELDPTWRSDTSSNARVVRGLLDGMNAHGKLVGIYSNHYQWTAITGGAYNPATPIWVPSGSNNAALARSFCAASHAFGNGQIWLTQWTVVYDQDYACAV